MTSPNHYHLFSLSFTQMYDAHPISYTDLCLSAASSNCAGFRAHLFFLCVFSTWRTAAFHLSYSPMPCFHQILVSVVLCFPLKQVSGWCDRELHNCSFCSQSFFQPCGSCLSDYALVISLWGKQHRNSLFSNFFRVVWQHKCFCFFSFIHQPSFSSYCLCLLF